MTRNNAIYGTIVIHPHILQFVIDELPLIVMTLTGFFCAGLEETTCTNLLLSICCVCTIILIYRFIYLRRMEYRVSNEQMIFEHGVFCRSSDYIELYRVVDFREHRSFFQQLSGLKTVSIYSGDRTTPRLDIKGVKDDINLVAHIRERVEYNKRRKGIYEITNR